MTQFLQDGGSGPGIDRDWWRGAVIYQIYPRSFQDQNGDGIGDLPGIIRRLPHVASLGVDAIWVSPFFRSPMKDFGYDVSDYRDVDPMFGTLDDFDELDGAPDPRAHQTGAACHARLASTRREPSAKTVEFAIHDEIVATPSRAGRYATVNWLSARQRSH